ncbi:MAG: tetratricopeptide repeat protein [Verrucomicrobia bacterium]|nr:tetratricopeptide repeat protein [Verrucomicrobiota bacterium]
MSTRPVIFISAVSRELHTARDLIAKTLLALGYEPKWQDIAATDAGDLSAVLRKWIDDSDAVIQLVGHCYGFAPTSPDPTFGPCSYTQYEALYARQKGKPVYYIFTDADHPKDGCACEPQTLHDLQETYRQTVKSNGALYHTTSSLIQTELLIRRLKDDLAHLRKRNRQIAVLLLGLLAALVLAATLMTSKQSESNQNISVLFQQNKELTEGLADLRQMFETSIKGGSETKLTSDYISALRFIAYKRGVDLDAFRVFLEQNATQALGNETVALKDKVRALQEAGKFVQARDFALEQARRLESERQKSSKEEVELWTEAAMTEFNLGHDVAALKYATNAVNQTDRQADFTTWSSARHQLGRILARQRKDKEAQALYEELIPMQKTALGPDHLAVLQSRRTLAVIIYLKGNYALAEQEGRALIADCQRVLGTEHNVTLGCRNNLAVVLFSEAKHAEAVQEYSAVLEIQKHTLGTEHPDTLVTRNNLANALDAQGRHSEAEQEHRAVLKVRERVLGVEHPDTLASRNNLAAVLQAKGAYVEAEEELRSVLQIQEHMLGAEHPNTAKSCFNLALCLESQQKFPEAFKFVQQSEQVRTKLLEPDHPDTKDAKALRERIEAAMK